MVEVSFDVVLDAPGGTPHVDGERRHGKGGRNGEDAFPERLIGRTLEEERGADTERDRDGNAQPHGGHELLATAFAQVGEADGDDEKGLEPFPQGDYERLEHGESKTRFNLKMYS
jgi:hypothetical protein